MKSKDKLIHLQGIFTTRLVYLNERFLDPEISQKIKNHSPDGFAWGYAGSGPAQLALAVLLSVTTVEEALQLYHQFKFNVIANLPKDDFDIRLDMEDHIYRCKRDLNLV